MSPLLRAIVVPLLLFFNITILYLFGTVLEVIGLLPPHFFTDNPVIRNLGVADYVLELIIAVNIVIIDVLLMLAIPFWLFRQDLRQTLERFGVMLSGVRVGQGDQPFLNAARDVFELHPDVTVFVYGHTHRASLTKWGDRVVVNTGTWLKKVQHVETWFSRLPGIYFPSSQLNYFRIFPEGDRIAVEYEQIKTDQPRDLTWIQRLVARKPPAPTTIPERTVVDPAGTLELPGAESGFDPESTTGGEPERESAT